MIDSFVVGPGIDQQVVTSLEHGLKLGDGQLDIPKLRTLLETILPQNSSFKEFEVEHHFPSIGKKRLLLDAQRLSIQGDHNGLILLGIDDVTEPLAK